MNDIFRNLKHRYQRQARGWSDQDTWSFDSYLAIVIIGGCKHLKKYIHGYPSNLKSIQEWKQILNEIIWTFEMVLKIVDMDIIYYTKKKKSWKEFNEKHNTKIRYMTRNEYLRYNKGWNLFRDYFTSLWD